MTARSDFWSRRRAQVEAEQRAEREAQQQAEIAQAEAELEVKSDAEILQELGLDDPDTLQPGDDFSQFMAKAVPERLRKRALRRLWGSNPVLACVDGLNDYDLDYTNAATDAPGVTTAYQVGKGMLEHILELARKAEEAALAEEQPLEHDEEGAPEQSGEAEEQVVQAQNLPAEPVEPAESVEPEGREEPAQMPPRRMRFQFEEGTA